MPKFATASANSIVLVASFFPMFALPSVIKELTSLNESFRSHNGIQISARDFSLVSDDEYPTCLELTVKGLLVDDLDAPIFLTDELVQTIAPSNVKIKSQGLILKSFCSTPTP